MTEAAQVRSVLREAVGYWEWRRIGYNVALAVLACAVVVRTWPHFLPAFTLQSLPPLLVLAALANACYCAAYLVEAAVADSPARERWQRRRWMLWVTGTLFALCLEYYWIADEIYPSVPYVR